MNRNWIFIIISGIIEVLWATGLKYSNGVITWIGVVMLIVLSFWLLFEATKEVPVATVYAVFTGIGTVGTVLTGMIFFNEAFSWNKILFITVLLIGILGLKIVTPNSDTKGEN